MEFHNRYIETYFSRVQGKYPLPELSVKNGRFCPFAPNQCGTSTWERQKHPPKPLRFWDVYGITDDMIFGYARVSTEDQKLDAQTDALAGNGAERVFAEKVTGSVRLRPQLEQMLDHLRPGDVVVVTKYDRLARSLRDLLDIVEVISDRGAGFRSLAEDIDTTTPAGRLVFHVFASIAQFERDRISERTKEGLQAARKRGRIGGRPHALSVVQRHEVCRMRDDEHRSLAEIARLFKVSTKTVRRA